MNIERLDIHTPVKPNLGLKAQIELWKILHGLGESNKQPLKRRLAIGASLAPAALGLLTTACADDQVNPTTTIETTIPSTTVPETTTTLPPTTTEPTTTTTSTTVPETTTTHPIEIYEPKGEVTFTGIEDPIGYGIIPFQKLEFKHTSYREMSKLITDFFQEENIWYGHYVAGKDVNNNWVIGTVKFGKNDDLIGVTLHSGSRYDRSEGRMSIEVGLMIEKMESILKENGAFQIVSMLVDRMEYGAYSEVCEAAQNSAIDDKICKYFTDFVNNSITDNLKLGNILSKYSHLNGNNLHYDPISLEDASIINNLIIQVWEIDVFNPVSQDLK